MKLYTIMHSDFQYGNSCQFTVDVMTAPIDMPTYYDKAYCQDSIDIDDMAIVRDRVPYDVYMDADSKLTVNVCRRLIDRYRDAYGDGKCPTLDELPTLMPSLPVDEIKARFDEAVAFFVLQNTPVVVPDLPPPNEVQ